MSEPPRRASHGIGLGFAPSLTATSTSRRPSAPITFPPRPPAIPRSTSVTASIDFFESKSRSTTPPRPVTTAPAKKDANTPGSPKPVGPRTMSPPSQGGRRLSYRPSGDSGSEGVRRSLDDPRKGLGINMDEARRASESGVAGPSRTTSREQGAGVVSPVREPSASGLPRRGSAKGKERASSSTTQAPLLARNPSSSRRDQPVLRPRQPSDRPKTTPTQAAPQVKPAIRIVQPTPSSHASRRRTSAPPESPITPTRSRAYSPAAVSSSSSQQSQAISLASTSSPRSIRPGSRRTSYQLGKSTSTDGSSARNSIISEFGVMGASKQSPRLGRFVESFDDGDIPSPRRPLAVGTSPEIPLDTGSPLLDTSPFIIQHANGTRTGDDSAFSSEAPSPSTSRASSYVSAKSPSSPVLDRPVIPTRTTSAAVVGSPPAISKRTSSIDGGPGSPSRSPSFEPSGQWMQTIASRSDSVKNTDNDQEEADGTETRRPSEVTAVGRTSLDGFSPTVSGRQLPDTTPPAHHTPSLGAPITPIPQLSTTSPRRDRKSPGLTIDPAPPPRPPRDSARPSPPIPAKSPLRRLTPQHPSLPDLREDYAEGRSPRVRYGSGESALATASTMNESFETAPLPSDSETSSPALHPGDTVPYPASYESGRTAEDEIRFTMLTVPSAYSQDSAPSTARTLPESEWSTASGRTDERSASASGSFGWGRQRHSIISIDGSLSGVNDAFNRSASLPRLRISSSDTGKSLPETPRETPSTAGTTSSASNGVVTGHSPLSPIRSPSMPVMNTAVETPRKAAITARVTSSTSPRISDVDVEMHATPKMKSGMTRSQTIPLANLAAQIPSSTTLTPSKSTLTIPTSPVVNGTASKRAHLVREIVSTERNYANDLALIRDAYLLRYIRPASGVSTVDSTAAPSETSRRSSIYTYQTAETKRSSGHDYPAPLLLPPQKSPAAIGDGATTSYFPGGMTASASTSSLAVMAGSGGAQQGSMRTTSGSSSIGSMAPPIGKPLSPTDIRTVFLNLDQLAAAAEEMATTMEAAIGDDGLSVSGREGEVGSDRLGEVFVNLVPRFRPLYSFYCARQSTASARLLEILSEPAHATFLNECWSHVKPHTHAWNLDSMLIKPVQRITKYPLLFEDLLACTTPVHADYFHIRNAAVMARSVAQEIDETKRRKDVVAGVISKKAAKTAKLSGDTRPKGLKLFRKEKSTSSIPPSTTSSSTATAMMPSTTIGGGGGGNGPDTSVAEITKASLAHFKELVNRVDQCEQCVRRVGKEVILWTAAAKDCSMIQDGLVKAWLGVVTLDGAEGPDPKMVWYRKVIAGIVSDAWRALNDEVQDQIMPALSKLLESGINPRKVISKRDLKAPDYARYFALAEGKKPIDRTIVQSARDFVALHTQLVEELPLFLEGYMRIFDLAMCAFASAQATYHAKVRERMGEYVREHLDGVRRSPKIAQGGGVQHARQPSGGAVDLSSIAGVVRNWSDAWTPYAEAVDHFQCTKPARQAATRLASFQDRPGSHTQTHSRQNSSHSRTGSRSNSPLPPASPSRPGTPRSPTFLNNHNRQRSTSLMGPPPLPSPTKEKSESRFFGGFSRPSKSPNMPSSQGNADGVMTKSSTTAGSGTARTGGSGFGSPMKDIPRLRSSSPVDPAIRNSFGLPTISPDNGKFGALGWSPIKSTSPSLRNTSDPTYPYLNGGGGGAGRRTHSRNGSTSSLSSNPGLGFGFTSTASSSGPGAGLGMTDLLRRRSSGRSRKSSSESSKSDRRRKAISMVSAMEVMSPTEHPSAPASREASRFSRPEHQRAKTEVDAAAGWRGERVLYQCACVAAFDSSRYGRRKYRGLDFLPMTVGDLFDILHEVGRIDALQSFPFPEVGVDNDGVLVAQGENGDIGLVICSFLEPLT